jgi:hypothetical protein
MRLLGDKTRWNCGNTAEIQPLVDALPSVRSHRQVAKLMGISRSSVFYIEKTALLKIARQMRALEK